MLNLIISIDTLEVIAGLSVAALATCVMFDFAESYIAHQNRVAKDMQR